MPLIEPVGKRPKYPTVTRMVVSPGSIFDLSEEEATLLTSNDPVNFELVQGEESNKQEKKAIETAPKKKRVRRTKAQILADKMALEGVN